MKDIKLIGKRIIASKCKTLFKYIPDENFKDYFMVKAGSWEYKDGYLIGTETGNRGGIIYTKEVYDKPVILIITASTILPASRDVNAVFYASWNEKTNDLGDSYVSGVGGWYDNKAGLERNMHNGGCSFRALTNSYNYKAGKEITIAQGAINGHLFFTVDDELVMEYIENEKPLTSGHMGVSPYCTMLKVKEIEIKEIYYEDVSEGYKPEF